MDTDAPAVAAVEAPAPAAAPKRKPAAKKPAAKKATISKAKKPTNEALILTMLAANPSRTGNSVRKILNGCKEAGATNEAALKRTLKKMIDGNRLVSVKGTGLS